MGFVGLGLIFIWMQFTDAINVDIADNTVVEKIDDLFVGICLSQGQVQKGFPLKSSKVQMLTKALSPAYIRIAGMVADATTFDPNAPDPKHFHRPFYMNGNMLDEIHTFVNNSGLKLIFGLSITQRHNGTWDPANAELLLNYSAQRGYSYAGFELGNERNAPQRNTTGTQQGRDFKALHRLLQNTRYKSSLIVGPDTAGYDWRYIKRFLSGAGPNVVDVLTFHSYYMNKAKATYGDFFKLSHLNHLHYYARSSVPIANRYRPHMPVWFGETSSMSSGGVKNISDSYTAGFMWLDKLGMCARYGIKGVLRQELIGANYGLLRHNTDPNPDYWLTVLYKKLVGNNVFSVTTSSTSLRAYAHCTKQPKEVDLNGHHLTVVNNQIPSMDPVKESIHSVTMPGKRFGFFVLPDARVLECGARHGTIIG